MKIVVTQETQRAMRSVWEQIASDADPECTATNEEAVELVIDADRLTTFGHKAADTEVKNMFRAYGYDSAIKALNAVKIV